MTTMATPRGFRDVLPEEALWREGIAQAVGAIDAATLQQGIDMITN